MIIKDYLYKDLMRNLNNSKYVPNWVSTFMGKPSLRTRIINTMKPLNVRLYYDKTDEHQLKHLSSSLQKLKSFLDQKKFKYNKINIILILSNKIKMIDRRQTKIIDTEHINSGLCIHTNDKNAAHIIIYRKEDLLKVLIHEIIHYLNLDLKFYDEKNIYIENRIQTFIPSLKNTEINFNEAYTEALARYYYAQFLYDNGYKNALRQQQEYSIKVVKKFLKLYDCENMEQFSRLKNYVEKSHPFAYIVITSALLNNNRFIEEVVNDDNVHENDLKSLENIVYEALLKENEWHSKINNTNVGNKYRFYLKLSI